MQDERNKSVLDLMLQEELSANAARLQLDYTIMKIREIDLKVFFIYILFCGMHTGLIPVVVTDAFGG